MALITCADCKSEISDAAPSCPKCGRPTRALSASSTADVSNSRASGALSYAAVGFLAGFTLVWGGCGNFRSMDGKEIAMCAMGGGLFAILGAILGAVVGGVRK